jgi:PPOX class probable F420-dependent enzyme
MSVIPEQYVDLLQSQALAHVATIGPNGEPQTNPNWFDWDGTSILLTQTKSRQKYQNVQRSPQVALSIVDPTNPYRYLEVRGKVIRVDEDKDLTFVNSMARKYLGRDAFPWHQPDDERVVIGYPAGTHDQPEHREGFATGEKRLCCRGKEGIRSTRIIVQKAPTTSWDLREESEIRADPVHTS